MSPLQQNPDEEFNALQLTALSLSVGAKTAKKSYLPNHFLNKFQQTTSENTGSAGGLMRTKKRRSLDNGKLAMGTEYSSSQFRMHGVGNFAAGSQVSRSECSGSRPHGIDNMPGGFSCENGASTTRGSEVNDVNKSCSYQQSVNGHISEKGSKMSASGRASETSVADKVHLRMIQNREPAARSRARKLALEPQQLEITELKKENNSLKGVVRFLLAILMTKHVKTPALSRSFSATF